MASTRIGTKNKTRPVGRGASGISTEAAARKGPSKGRPEAAGRGSKGLPRQGLRQEVVRELVKLRLLLKDVGTNCLDRLDGELAGLALSLAGESLPGDPPVLPNPPTLMVMLAEIRAFEERPKKGRAKDLRRIEALLKSLNGRMPPED